MRLVQNDRGSGDGLGAGGLAGLTGSITALVTPFHDGRVDVAALAGLCERQVQAGTAALVACGSTGEAPALSALEQRLVIETVVAAVRGRVPVVAGCGAPATEEAVQRARTALRAGADGLLCAPPPYSRPTQAGIVAHVRAVAAVGLPVILYDVPGRTGVAVSDETVAALDGAGCVVGLKDAAGDVSRPVRLRAMGVGLRLYGGDDSLAAAQLAMGGDGCVSVTANLVPGLCQALQLAWVQGDLVAFGRWRDVLAPLHEALFRVSNPILVKAALALAGLCEAGTRLPLLPADPGMVAALAPVVGTALAAERALAAGPGRSAAGWGVVR